MVEAGRLPQQAADEIGWIRGEAVGRPWMRGIVAHADIEAPDVEPILRGYGADPLVVGVRRNLQDDPDGFIGSPTVRRGVRLLGEHGLPFDACVRPGRCRSWSSWRGLPGHDDRARPSRQARSGPGHDAWRVAVAGWPPCPTCVQTVRPGHRGTPRTPARLLSSGPCVGAADVRSAALPVRSDWPIMNLATSCADWLDTVREAVDHHEPAWSARCWPATPNVSTSHLAQPDDL